MTALPKTNWFMTVQDYLSFEEKSDVRHEYVAGEVHAMVGATERHQIIAFNIASALREEALRRGWRVILNDVKLQTDVDTIYYPDIMVLCDPDDDDPYIKTRPTLVVEVLSPSTESIDRREKMIGYRKISSLLCYLVVHQDERRVEQHWRDAIGDPWEYTLQLEDFTREIAIPGLDSKLTFDGIYEGVEFDVDD